LRVVAVVFSYREKIRETIDQKKTYKQVFELKAGNHIGLNRESNPKS